MIKPNHDRPAQREPATSQPSNEELQRRLKYASPLAGVGKVAAGAAHEINQPLNVIRMAAFNLRRGIERGAFDATAALEKLAVIDAQISRAAELVGGMKSFSTTSQRGATTVKPVIAMRVALALLARRFSALEVHLEHTGIETDCELQAEPSALQTLIIALVDNALEALAAQHASAQDPVALLTAAAEPGAAIHHAGDTLVREITVREAIVDSRYQFTVEDTGGGIPDSVMPYVFEPFFTTATDGKHPGMGLPLALDIVEALGGTLELANSGSGLRATVSLPVTMPLR